MRRRERRRKRRRYLDQCVQGSLYLNRLQSDIKGCEIYI
jgi:hypothetical protein